MTCAPLSQKNETFCNPCNPDILYQIEMYLLEQTEQGKNIKRSENQTGEKLIDLDEYYGVFERSDH